MFSRNRENGMGNPEMYGQTRDMLPPNKMEMPTIRGKDVEYLGHSKENLEEIIVEVDKIETKK